MKPHSGIINHRENDGGPLGWGPLNKQPHVHLKNSGYLLGISPFSGIIKLPSLKLTASLHLKIGGWKRILSFWDSANFQGRTVSFWEGTCLGESNNANMVNWKDFPYNSALFGLVI